MKTKEDLADLRVKTFDELNNELISQRKKLATLQIDRATGKLKDHQSLSKTRRKIARLQTVMRELRGFR